MVVEKFDFHREIKCDLDGYQHLVDLYRFIKEIRPHSSLILDLSETTWFEANLCAMFGAALTKGIEKGVQVVFNLNAKIESIFERNGFLQAFGGQKKFDAYGSTISYEKFRTNDGNKFGDYIDNNLLSMSSLPEMSKGLKTEIGRSIFEIFENSKMHGGLDNKYVFSCGQVFPKAMRLRFTIVDLGKTVRTNVRKFLKSEIDGKDAIQWAIIKNNSTKTYTGGLGYSLIREFLQLNNGKLQILSADGFYEEERGITNAKNIVQNFFGTVVNLEFNLLDKNSHILETHLSANAVL